MEEKNFDLGNLNLEGSIKGSVNLSITEEDDGNLAVTVKVTIEKGEALELLKKLFESISIEISEE